jgi:hypothetical protein
MSTALSPTVDRRFPYHGLPAGSSEHILEICDAKSKGRSPPVWAGCDLSFGTPVLNQNLDFFRFHRATGPNRAVARQRCQD